MSIVTKLVEKLLTTIDIFLTIHDMISQSFISTTFVRLLYEYLEKQGINGEALLGSPCPDPRDKGLSRYPLDQWRKDLETASVKLNAPHLGLCVGQLITAAHVGVLGYVILSCDNLAEALTRFERFARLVYDAELLEKRIENNCIILEWGVESGRPGPLVDEAAVVSLVQFARDITGKTWPLEAVSFVNPKPENTKVYDDYFGCQVAFDQENTIARFSVECLTLPLRQPDPVLLNILEDQAESLLSQLPVSDDLKNDVIVNIGFENNNFQNDDFEKKVRSEIIRLCSKGEPTLKNVAEVMSVTPRTLQRHLADRNLQFQPLLNELRGRLANEYLSDLRLQLSEIALLLGYSEQSSFNRAYKKWAGLTPRQARLKYSKAVGGYHSN